MSTGTVPLPGSKIDNLDYSILWCVREVDRTAWKSLIHELMQDYLNHLPLSRVPSVQTIGRRVDRLVDGDLLEVGITNPSELKRDLIIGFKLTDAGHAAIQAKRDLLLQDVVRNTLFSTEETEHIGKPALIELITDKFQLDPSTQDYLNTEFTGKELVILLNLYYTQKAVKTLDMESRTKFHCAAKKSQTLNEFITGVTPE